MIDELRAIATDIGQPFFFGYPENLNEQIAAENLPAIYCVMPTGIGFSNFRFSNYQTTIFFADNIDPEADDETKFGVIESCNKTVAKFFKRLKESGTLYYSNVVSTVFDFELNVRCCGVAVTLTIRELRETCNDLT
ncbi:MAG TPA: hypothetical protein PLL08_04190 [Bacteroidales bacterium]|mgnify:FL=1|nr:hypothetical protein [Bacteroidales bacterium]